MTVHEPVRALRTLVRSCSRSLEGNPLECLAPRFSRSMATEAPMPAMADTARADGAPNPPSDTSLPAPSKPQLFSEKSSKPTVLTTIFSWPTLEPLRFQQYPSNYLHLPLRRDLLHRAVIYEGDKTRQGTASTKWRKDVHGSSRKLRPQKGTGSARVGSKKSPTRKGGGVAFGPHPRDFSTGLQRKVYDLAWRTALSYRYRRGQLLIVDNNIAIPKHTGPHLLSNIFEGNKWDSRNGRATLVTARRRERLFREMGEVSKHGIAKDMFDIDVKDLLMTGRIVIEKQALDTLLLAHKSDIGARHTMKHAAHLTDKARRRSGSVREIGDAVDLDETDDANQSESPDALEEEWEEEWEEEEEEEEEKLEDSPTMSEKMAR